MERIDKTARNWNYRLLRRGRGGNSLQFMFENQADSLLLQVQDFLNEHFSGELACEAGTVLKQLKTGHYERRCSEIDGFYADVLESEWVEVGIFEVLEDEWIEIGIETLPEKPVCFHLSLQVFQNMMEDLCSAWLGTRAAQYDPTDVQLQQLYRVLSRMNLTDMDKLQSALSVPDFWPREYEDENEMYGITVQGNLLSGWYTDWRRDKTETFSIPVQKARPFAEDFCNSYLLHFSQQNPVFADRVQAKARKQKKEWRKIQLSGKMWPMP